MESKKKNFCESFQRYGFYGTSPAFVLFGCLHVIDWFLMVFLGAAEACAFKPAAYNAGTQQAYYFCYLYLKSVKSPIIILFRLNTSQHLFI